MSWMDPTMSKEIIDKLWGCEENCPFCGEPCERSERNHENYINKNENTVPHFCQQHKPQGFSRWQWQGSDRLSRENCSFLVQYNGKFECTPETCVNYEQCTKDGQIDQPIQHHFRDYKIHLPNWDFPTSYASFSSPYWMWAAVRYFEELSKVYMLKPPSFPKSWKKLTKEDAKKSLNNLNEI